MAQSAIAPKSVLTRIIICFHPGRIAGEISASLSTSRLPASEMTLSPRA